MTAGSPGLMDVSSSQKQHVHPFRCCGPAARFLSGLIFWKILSSPNAATGEGKGKELKLPTSSLKVPGHTVAEISAGLFWCIGLPTCKRRLERRRPCPAERSVSQVGPSFRGFHPGSCVCFQIDRSFKRVVPVPVLASAVCCDVHGDKSCPTLPSQASFYHALLCCRRPRRSWHPWGSATGAGQRSRRGRALQRQDMSGHACTHASSVLQSHLLLAFSPTVRSYGPLDRHGGDPDRAQAVEFASSPGYGPLIRLRLRLREYSSPRSPGLGCSVAP